MLGFKGIIDIHTHPFTEETVKGQGVSYREAHDFFGSRPEAPHHESWFKNKRTMSIETSAEQIRVGGYVQAAVVLNMNACCTWGAALPNDYIAQYCDRVPDLYIGYAGIDPNMPVKSTLRELDRCATDLKIAGLKFHPAYQDFWPNDKEKLYPIYERCVEYDLPILFHTGLDADDAVPHPQLQAGVHRRGGHRLPGPAHRHEPLRVAVDRGGARGDVAPRARLL